MLCELAPADRVDVVLVTDGGQDDGVQQERALGVDDPAAVRVGMGGEPVSNALVLGGRGSAQRGGDVKLRDGAGEQAAYDLGSSGEHRGSLA